MPQLIRQHASGPGQRFLDRKPAGKRAARSLAYALRFRAPIKMPVAANRLTSLR